MCPNRCGNDANSSDPSADVSHEISVDSVDDAGIDISERGQGIKSRIAAARILLLTTTHSHQ